MTIKITFGTSMDGSQEELDPWSSISVVTAQRTASKIGVEDKEVKGQRAHITADVVLEKGIERLLFGKNWVSAWHEVYGLWTYLQGITTTWGSHPVLGAHSKTELAAIAKCAGDNAAVASTECRRQDVDLEYAFYVEPIAGNYDQRKAQRTYFDHDPEDSEVPNGSQKARWVPNLGTNHVKRLSDNLELWVATRVQLPWTSLDTDSFKKGDMAGPRKVELAIGAVGGAALPNAQQADTIAAAMLLNFDFFPPSITKARTLTHAGAVGARHVAECFKLYPDIQETWWKSIATAFLNAWYKETIGLDKGAATPGIHDLLKGWADVAKVYTELVVSFGESARVDWR